LVGGATSVLHRAFHFGNDRLQLVEETVEPARELPQFILLVVGQATCQVAFAAGDVFEHVCHAEDRSRHAAGHQPYQDQADHRGQQAQAQFQQRATRVVGIQLRLQCFGWADQDFFRHIQQYAPQLAVGDRRERRQHLELKVGAQAADLWAAGQCTEHFRAADGVDLIQAFA